MEALIVLFTMFLTFIPIIFIFVIYFAIIALVVWFVVVFLKNQKERNDILRAIYHRLPNNPASATDHKTVPGQEKQENTSETKDNTAAGSGSDEYIEKNDMQDLVKEETIEVGIEEEDDNQKPDGRD